MSTAWGARNLTGFFFLLAITTLLSFTAAAGFAEPVRESPTVSSIAIVSSPARGDTYELGERIEVAVEFNIAVTATGRPQMALTIGTETRHATFSRSDGESLFFAYDVHEEDRDEDGISIAANPLILDGGTITADDGAVDADLAHKAVSADGGSKVNGSLFSPPAVRSISFHSSPAKDDTYELGETIALLVEFDRVVTATGEAQAALTIGPETRHATAYGWGGHRHPSLHFSYTVQETDRDEDGISIPANALSLDGGTIKGPDGTTDADLTHDAIAAESNSKVYGSRFSPPAVQRIFFGSSPARDDTFELGETIGVMVVFDREVTATGGVQLALTIGTETRHVTTSGWGSQSGLYFEYTVQEADRDEDGISIAANALALDGGTIKGPDGTTDADLTHEAVTAGGGSKVDGSRRSPPEVSHLYFMSALAGDGTYELGATVDVVVQFNKMVTVTGSPKVALTIGDETRYAAYSRSWPGDRSVHFSYTVQEGDRDDDGISIPANGLILDGGSITDDDGATDADLTHAPVGPDRRMKVDGASDVAPPRVKRIYVDSSPERGDTYQLGETIRIVVEFDRAVKTTREARLALTIGIQTRHATAFGWGSHTLDFQYTVQAADRDEDGISIPANALSLDGGTITAADGTTNALLTHEAMAPDGDSKVNGSDVTPPRVKAISFDYSPARGDTYELGETIEVAVEFDRAVQASGEPRVALTIGTETRHASFRGWGTQRLYFEYTVQEGDRDDEGITIPANALSLNGGTITAADGTTNADLTHGSVAAGSRRKVNGGLASPPGVTHIYFSDFPARGNTYELGEEVRVGVHFDKVVKVTGRPQVELTIGAETRSATLSTRWEDDRYVHFSYVVQEGDRDEDGISIAANALALNGGTITAADGTTDADLAHAAVGPERDRQVDGSSDVAPPRVTAIHFDSSPARGDTYELGETVKIVVTFDGGVEATPEPQIALTIGTETRHATFSGWGSNSLYFRYTVQERDRDEDGISIPANALVLSGGTITAPDGTTRADLTHAAVAADGGSKVNGGLVAPPRVRDISFFHPGRSHTYARGETIEVTVAFNRTVTVTGNPRVALTIGDQTRHAAYSGSWREYADFSYVVQEDDRDEDGISIPANALVLNGGTITAADGTTDADLAHAAVGPHRDMKVDGSRAVTPPRVKAIYYDSSPAQGDTYELGETVEVVVEFDGGVEATGDPQVALTIGTETRYATFFGWSSDNTLRFRYTVQTGDNDEDGISIPANSLLLNGGSITGRDGTTEAVLTHAAMAAEPGPKVNGNDVTAPAVTGIYLVSSPARGGTYELGETIEVVVEFDRAVTETGNPQLALTIGREMRHAISAGWGSESLFFSYTVQEGDRDDDGISIAADSLLLGGGAITATDGTSDADLRHDAISARDSKVNGSLISPPGVSGIYFISAPNRGDTYIQGETIEVLVEFDRAMTVTGNPQVALTIGAQTRYAAYSTAWEGDRLMHFSYAVQEDDRDETGVTITANALSLNGGTITHAADRTVDADLTHGAVPAEPAFKVNGSRGTP